MIDLETTAEERAIWFDHAHSTPAQRGVVQALTRDIATLLAEVARLSTQLQIANAEIVRLSASREEIREQLEIEVARLKAELAEAHAHILTDREELAACMTRRSLATGHGDTLGDLLHELDGQLAEATAREAEARRDHHQYVDAFAKLEDETTAREAAARAEEQERLAKMFDDEAVKEAQKQIELAGQNGDLKEWRASSQREVNFRHWAAAIRARSAP